MTKNYLPFVTVLLCGMLIGAFVFGRQSTPTWEYDFMTYQGPFNPLDFDERGADGWEIAAVFKNHTYPSRETVVLKRRR
ncbi:MAG: hypothetical protein JWO95_2572 [Verrucomicrobiales bacterium]|nr:hypothetical protein [Verrucomicrobiales bacterium]